MKLTQAVYFYISFSGQRRIQILAGNIVAYVFVSNGGPLNDMLKENSVI